jgi:hypothetical protein
MRSLQFRELTELIAFSNALQSPAFNGDTNIVKLLLSRGADVAAGSGHYPCAVDAALRGNQEDILTALLGAGADPNAQCSKGSALQLAVETRRQPAIELLLARGATIPEELPVAAGASMQAQNHAELGGQRCPQAARHA